MTTHPHPEAQKSAARIADAHTPVCVAMDHDPDQCHRAMLSPMLPDPKQAEALRTEIANAPPCLVCGRPLVGLFGPWALVSPSEIEACEAQAEEQCE